MDAVVAFLLLLGGANRGLIGAFEVNVITAPFGEGSMVIGRDYGLGGLGALYRASQVNGPQRRSQGAAHAH